MPFTVHFLGISIQVGNSTVRFTNPPSDFQIVKVSIVPKLLKKCHARSCHTYTSAEVKFCILLRKNPILTSMLIYLLMSRSYHIGKFLCNCVWGRFLRVNVYSLSIICFQGKLT